MIDEIPEIYRKHLTLLREIEEKYAFPKVIAET